MSVALDDRTGQVEATVVRLIDRTDTNVRVTLRADGREDVVREWPLDERVTVVRGPLKLARHETESTATRADGRAYDGLAARDLSGPGRTGRRARARQYVAGATRRSSTM